MKDVLSGILHEVFCETDAALMDKNKLARTISCVLDKYKSSKFSIRNIRTLIEKQKEDIESEESSASSEDIESIPSAHGPELGDNLKQYLETYGKHLDYFVGPSVEEIIANKETRSKTAVNVLDYLRNQEQFDEYEGEVEDKRKEKGDIQLYKITTPIVETEEEEPKTELEEGDHFDIVGDLFEPKLEKDLHIDREIEVKEGEKQEHETTENVSLIKEN